MDRSGVVIGSIGLMLGISSFLFLPQIFTDCTSTVSQIDAMIPYDLAEKCSMLDSIELTTEFFGINAVEMIQLGTMISVLISIVILIYGAVVTTESPQMKKYALVKKTIRARPPSIIYSKSD